MRNKRPIDVLFPKTRQGVLAATYGQPERWWFLSELASQLKTSPSSLQRELRSLAASGLLRHRRDGKRLYFQAETDSPVFAPLRDLVMQTLGVTTELQGALAAFGNQVRCAFIYGSFARSEDHAQSDVDVMVVGSLGLSDLSSPLRTLERKFAREFNVTCYSTQEFRKKARAGNHFLTNVLKGKKIFLKGDVHELDEIAGEPHGATTHDERRRDRRVA